MSSSENLLDIVERNINSRLNKLTANDNALQIDTLLLTGIYQELVAARKARERTPDISLDYEINQTPPTAIQRKADAELSRRRPGRPRKIASEES